eukprot:1024348-Pelagomonas_calceolata.AAC.5
MPATLQSSFQTLCGCPTLAHVPFWEPQNPARVVFKEDCRGRGRELSELSKSKRQAKKGTEHDSRKQARGSTQGVPGLQQ